MFFLAMNTVYAYFTATATPQKSLIKTATVKLVFKESGEDSDVFLTSTVSNSDYSADLLPGGTVSISGEIENRGTADIYAIIKCEVFVGGVKDANLTKYFSPSGDLIYDGSSFSSYSENDVLMDGLTVDEKTEEETYVSSSFTIDYEFDFDTDDSSQGKTVKFDLTALGIQTSHIEYDDAVEYLITNMGNNQI